MTGPPERMEEHFGSELGLSPPPVDLLALRAIEGAFLGRPHGPPHASALASWAVSPERRVALPCNLLGGGVDSRFIRQQRAEGKLPPTSRRSRRAAPRRTRRGTTTSWTAGADVHLPGGALAAVHLPASSARAPGSSGRRRRRLRLHGLYVSIRRSIMYNEARDQKLLDEAREAAEAALRTGRLDVMREILAKRPKRRPRAAATARPRRGKKKKKKEHERGPRIVTGVQRGQGATVPIPYGADTNANRRLHLLNGHLVGVLEYLFPALCAIDVKAGCDMAEIALKVLERHPYSYGTWTMHWMNRRKRELPFTPRSLSRPR
eukprot:tig00020539_g10391.t1